MCALVQVCDAVHSGAHRKLFCVEPRTRPAARKDKREKTGNRKIAIRDFSKLPDRRKSKLSRVNLELIAVQQAAAFFVTIGGKAECSIFRCSPTRSTNMHSQKESVPSQQRPQ
jgi:hypothetical protein